RMPLHEPAAGWSVPPVTRREPGKLAAATRSYADLYGEPAAPSMPMAEVEAGEVPPLGYVIAQLHGIYILAENAEGLVVVDMHAALERITYERLKQAMDLEGLRSQPLLVPETLAVSQRQADCAEEHAQWSARLG